MRRKSNLRPEVKLPAKTSSRNRCQSGRTGHLHITIKEKALKLSANKSSKISL